MERFKVWYNEDEENFLIFANDEHSKTIHPEEVVEALWEWLRRKE